MESTYGKLCRLLSIDHAFGSAANQPFTTVLVPVNPHHKTQKMRMMSVQTGVVLPGSLYQVLYRVNFTSPNGLHQVCPHCVYACRVCIYSISVRYSAVITYTHKRIKPRDVRNSPHKTVNEACVDIDTHTL